MKSADLRHHALELLELSKGFLAEDGDLDPTAFIVTADDQLLRPIELHDETAKIESCKMIVDEARQQKALAIITVFLARSRNAGEMDFEQETYSWGDIQDTSAERSILVTISGPGIQNWAAALPFRDINGKIVFRDLAEYGDGVDLGIFPGWSEQTTRPTPS